MRRFCSLAMIFVLVLTLAVPLESAADREIRVRINDEYVVFDVKPVVEQGRTLVPFRAIFEKLGAEVSWDGTANAVTAHKGETSIRLVLDSRTATVNGVPLQLDVAPKVISGRTMVPLRFIVQSMGYQIEWVEATHEIIITVPLRQPAIVTAQRTNPITHDAQRTGGTGVQLTFAQGRAEAAAPFAALPATATPGPAHSGVFYGFRGTDAKWIGFSIPIPEARVPVAGEVTLVVKEANREDVRLGPFTYTAAVPLQYFLAAKAPARAVTLELLWAGAFAETLHLTYRDTTPRLADNLFVHTAAADFTGTHDRTGPVTVGDGAFALLAVEGRYPTQGSYTSPVINTQPFEYLVMSWNADTPPGTFVETEARALRADGLWTGWMSWGRFGRYIDSARANTLDDLVRMDTDVFTVRGQQREEFVALQYRVTLNSTAHEATPTVRLVAGTIRNTQAGRTIAKHYDRAAVNPQLAVDLAVPQFSQRLRDPQHAARICAPTSLTMVMAYHGVLRLVEEFSRATYDAGFRAYGNWSFNAAVAGSEGFVSYVDYFGFTDEESINLVRLELARGNPIITSVRYVNSVTVAAPWPLLEGAPIASTSGHIVVIRGIVERNGVLFFICNDSAAGTDAGVYREYRVDQFLRAWHQRVAIIVRPSPNDGGTAAPRAVAARLEATGRTRESAGVTLREYALMDGAGNRVSLSTNNGARIISIVYQKESEPAMFIPATDEENLWVDARLIGQGHVWTFVLPRGQVFRATLN